MNAKLYALTYLAIFLVLFSADIKKTFAQKIICSAKSYTFEDCSEKQIGIINKIIVIEDLLKFGNMDCMSNETSINCKLRDGHFNKNGNLITFFDEITFDKKKGKYERLAVSKNNNYSKNQTLVMRESGVCEYQNIITDYPNFTSSLYQ